MNTVRASNPEGKRNKIISPSLKTVELRSWCGSKKNQTLYNLSRGIHSPLEPMDKWSRTGAKSRFAWRAPRLLHKKRGTPHPQFNSVSAATQWEIFGARRNRKTGCRPAISPPLSHHWLETLGDQGFEQFQIPMLDCIRRKGCLRRLFAWYCVEIEKDFWDAISKISKKGLEWNANIHYTTKRERNGEKGALVFKQK